MGTLQLLTPSLQNHLPFFLVFGGVSTYVLVYLVFQYFKAQKAIRDTSAPAKLDHAEKGDVVRKQNLAETDQFELEKRAFLSKTWLFVCHRSGFDKIGDYYTFSVAGISFFIVLGKDLKLRAFHNVCRHRAYTVVRKSCGTSSRFSCKYHGWQYDDQGKLVKAPQFDQSSGFQPEQNGLYEIKLLVTQEGLLFVNFDASTTGLPFSNFRSKFGMGNCTWLDGFNVAVNSNWKDIAREFSEQVQWNQSTISWAPSFRRKPRDFRLLGPLAMVKDLDGKLWCTMKLLPRSAGETEVRCEFYGAEGAVLQKAALGKWRPIIEEEIETIKNASVAAAPTQTSNFTYECGGRMIDLAAILSQHQRNESLAKKKLRPAIQAAGQEEVDQEASAICDALDSVQSENSVGGCPKLRELGRRIEW